jgi:hypothetical protein
MDKGSGAARFADLRQALSTMNLGNILENPLKDG